VAAGAGLDVGRVVIGDELRRLSDEALGAVVEQVDVFAQVEPHQKARLVAAARHRGRIAGFLGDGINDAGALRAADVGISVEGATDVARDTADIVLRHAGLDVVVAERSGATRPERGPCRC
jgi:Mg2+-importing ATPase